tara:strand:+ start:21074 stop:21568 length:495 start_codon:yes stop_codon:yes gene_type:complete
MTTVIRSNPDIREIEDLLYEEAFCLDRADLNAFYELYTEDGTYWMPVKPDQEDPLNHISIFYDDKLLMNIRRINFHETKAPSLDHPVRCSHIISNIRVEHIDEATGDITVTSNFHALLYYKNQQVFGGTYRHVLARTEDGLKIRHKRVDLINCDAALDSLVIYL